MSPKPNSHLWQIVLTNFEKYFVDGLCSLLADLKLNEIITESEYLLLFNDISDYQLENGLNQDEFIWPRGEKPKRLEFIKNRI